MSKVVKRGRLLGVDYVKVTVDTGRDSFVQQQYKDEVDVATIVRRFGLGSPPVYNQGTYGDFTGITDYASAAAAVERAQAGFMNLPAEAREKFENDPGKFLAYADRVTPDELNAFCGLKKLPGTGGAAAVGGNPPDPAAVVVAEVGK